jgi:PTS system fructose-specific IIC component
MIQKADYVIIAADINVELDRFVNKKIYQTNTNEAINTPIQALKNTIHNSTVLNNTNKSFSTAFDNGKKNGFMKHFLNGVSHMIPFVVFSGILYALIHIIVVSVRGRD